MFGKRIAAILVPFFLIGTMGINSVADTFQLPEIQQREVTGSERELLIEKHNARRLTRGNDINKDTILYQTNGGAGRQILNNYTPTREFPLVSLLDTPMEKDISRYSVAVEKKYIKPCEDCNEEMEYVDILYDVNSDCSHGIFAMGNYCKTDNKIDIDAYYTQCGC